MTATAPKPTKYRGYEIRGDNEGGWEIRRWGRTIDRAASINEAKHLIDWQQIDQAKSVWDE